MRHVSWIVITVLTIGGVSTALARSESDIATLVTQYIEPVRPKDGIVGIAVALRVGGSATFCNFGNADETSGRPITSELVV